MFLNEQTNEFLFYQIKVVAADAGILQHIELVTPVWETATAFI